MFGVIHSENKPEHILLGRNFGKRMIDLAQRKVIIGQRLFQNKSEILFESAVVEIDGTGSISQPAFFYAAFEMEKKCPQF
jgi:hypothetical protein